MLQTCKDTWVVYNVIKTVEHAEMKKVLNRKNVYFSDNTKYV